MRSPIGFCFLVSPSIQLLYLEMCSSFSFILVMQFMENPIDFKQVIQILIPPTPARSQANFLSSFLLPLPETTQPLSCSGYNVHVLTSCLLLPVQAPLWSFLHTTVFANTNAVMLFSDANPCILAWLPMALKMRMAFLQGRLVLANPLDSPSVFCISFSPGQSYQPSFTLDLTLIPSATGPLHTPLRLHRMLSLSVF